MENVLKKETMTSRERVLRSINHQPVDRIPIDLGMHTATGISAFAYWHLRERLGLKNDDIQLASMVLCAAKVEQDVLERFHCDCMMLKTPWENPVRWSPRAPYTFTVPAAGLPKPGPNDSWIVENGGRMRMPKDSYFFDGAWLDFDNRLDPKWIQRTAREAERIFKETDYFTSILGFGGFFNEADIEWQCKMITDPEEILAGNEMQLKIKMEMAGKYFDAMGHYVQGICLGGDLGTQQGPMVRPSLFEELCAPFLKKLCAFIHRNSDLKIFYHCCGSIDPMIPILIDCGIDVLNPVQISADNMDPTMLKEKYGKQITFWGGGCDTQRILNNGTPAEVAENVRTLMGIFKQNTGYVFNQVHNIMGDIPTENIITMLDTAYECSFFDN